MIILLGFIMVVSISCSIFYGAASFAYFDLYKEHEYYFKKRYRRGMLTSDEKSLWM